MFISPWTYSARVVERVPHVFVLTVRLEDPSPEEPRAAVAKPNPKVAGAQLKGEFDHNSTGIKAAIRGGGQNIIRFLIQIRIEQSMQFVHQRGVSRTIRFVINI